MEKYIINNVEYTFDQISNAAKENGVDIDTYINDMGAQVVTDAVEDPVEKPEAVVEETAPATAVTGLQLENGSSEPVNYNQYSEEDIDNLKARFDQGNFKTNQSEAYLNYKQTGNLDASLLPEKYSRPINPETNKPFTAMEWVKNSLYNDDVMMEAASDFRSGEGAIDVMSASILRKLYGKENAEKMVAEDAKDGETFWTDGMSEEELVKGIKRVEELNNKRKQTASIVEGFKEGDLGQTAAGIANAVIQTYSSLKYAAGTALTGWFTDFYAQNYVNVNKAEAERKGIDFEDYITSGEDNVLTPFITSYVQSSLERIGAEGIIGKETIKSAGKKIIEKVAGKEIAEKALKTNAAAAAKNSVIGAAKAEAKTEVGQSAAEVYAETLAKTDSVSDALAESVGFVFSEDGLEVALQGAFGGGIARFSGKNLKKGYKTLRETRAAIDDNKTEQLVDELSELNKQLIGATDEDVKQGLESQIKEKSAELDGLVTKANGIVDGMTNDEIDEINNMSDLAQAQIQRVNALNAKKKAGDINNDEYLSALEGYKAEFVKAKNRIKGIVEEAADTTPEKVSQRTIKNADAINNAFDSETMHRVNEETGKTELTDKGLDFFHNTVVPNMTDLVTRVGNRMFKENPEFTERGYTKREFINDLIYSSEDVKNKASSLIGLVTSFKPEKDQLLTTYITRNLENRSKRILAERVGDQATVGGTSIDTQEAKQLEAEEITIPETKGPKFVKRLNLSDEIMNKARKAAIKALSTAKNVDDKKFVTDIVNTVNSEIFGDIRALVPKPKEREAFMQEFAGVVWDAMPQSSMAKATRNETFKKWGLEAPTKKEFIDYFLGRDQEGLATNTINDRARLQLPQYLAKAIGAEYAEDLLKNDPEVRERFKLTQKQEVEEAAADIEALAVEEVTTVSEKDLKLKAGNDFLSRIFKNYKDSEFVNNLKNKAHLLRPSINKVKVLDKQKADNIAAASTAIAKSFPSELHKLFKNGYTEIVGFHYRYLDPAKAIKKEKIVLDEITGEQITLSPGEAGSYYSSLQDILQNQKSLEQLFKDGDISEALYNKFKNIDFEKIQIQNIKTGLKKGDFLFEVKKILGEDISAKEKEAKILEIYDPKIFENNKKLAEAIVLSMQDLYNAGKIDKTQLASILQYQTDIAAGFRGLTGFLGVELKDGPQKLSALKGEHLKPNAITMNEIFDVIVNNNSVEGLFDSHDQVFGDKKVIMDPADNALGRTSAVEGKLRITKTTSKETSKSIFVPSENTNLYDLTVKEWVKTFKDSPDLAAAKVDVELEKRSDGIETLIDRAIGKLEDYLGPKGALQANFAAVPINILIGGLRATKLAYRGSKNLAKALEAGYKKVQDYMSQQEWLDFAKQAVTEVKKEPTGTTVALAIANEKAIKNEQDRQNKIEVLKKAKVYSKADENKTSKQLDERLAEEDAKIRSNNRTEGMERNFRRILRMQTAKGKRPSKWFIPSNAEDIKGLLYAFLPDGKAGVEAKKFFTSAILKPYSDAIAAAEAEVLQLSKKFVELKDNAKVKLDENIEGTPYTMGDAIKVYNWNKAGVEVDILKQEYLDKLIGAVEANANAKYLADEVATSYDIEYDKNWRGVPFNKSIYDAINKGTRTKHLQTFSENVDAIFNKDNLQEIENAFGKSYTQALRNSLKRMQTGRNRISTDAQSNKFLNWINKSVATTMFLNTRSAALQLLSSLNFIGQKDNNIFQATKAFANQEQWQEDYNKLWNSDYLTNRREGAKFDVLADEIAENQESFLNKLLQKGFLPTRYADSFAIALGGAAFYRNRANALMDQGMTKEEAEAQAMKDWQASAEETQQSSDPSKISEIQASSVGKIIYAFANTPFQYARKSKRLLQDVVSGRSKSEGGMNQVRKDLQSVFYYTVGQAMLFNALQSALFASMFSDDEEDKLEEKTVTAIERALTSYAKSLGNPGAVVASLYSVLAEADEQIEKRGRIDNPYKLALEATAISPPLNTKLKDIVAIGNIYKYNHKQIQNDPFEAKLDNPVLEIAGNAASFAGYPLDRAIRKAQNLEAAMNEQTDAWEKVFLTLGWSKWELGVEDPKKKSKKKFKSSFEDNKFESAFNRLERGVAGKAYNDGSIEVDPNLSPVEREKTIAHEKQHVKDMNAGKLNYDDNFVYWNGGKHKRADGKIEYKGKMVEEGHPSLPWEKRAYDAEPSTKEIKEKKKRTKLY